MTRLLDLWRRLTRSRRTFRPVACPVCGALLILKPDPEREGIERRYCGHCGTFH